MIIELSVPGMTCGHCKASVEREVSALVGVEAIDVDLDTKVVRVHGVDLDRDALVAAIDEAGFDAS